MKVNRKQINVIRNDAEQSDFADYPPEELVDFVWQLSRELWSLSGNQDAERPLQRNIVTLYRK